MYINYVSFSGPEEKDELVTDQSETSNKKHRRKKSKANPNAESTNIDIVSKEKSMDITENDVQNNLHNSDDKKEDEKNKDAQKKDTINKSKKQKRKNKLKTDDDVSSFKKIKIDNTADQKKKKNKNSQFNQINTGKRKLDHDDPTMSLDAKRLKTYGINAKKLRNKLKYGNKKL